LLAFDINEIVFENELDEDTNTSAVLGIAVLSQMILGYE
jgi:hypothetical protein